MFVSSGVRGYERDIRYFLSPTTWRNRGPSVVVVVVIILPWQTRKLRLYESCSNLIQSTVNKNPAISCLELANNCRDCPKISSDGCGSLGIGCDVFTSVTTSCVAWCYDCEQTSGSPEINPPEVVIRKMTDQNFFQATVEYATDPLCRSFSAACGGISNLNVVLRDKESEASKFNKKSQSIPEHMYCLYQYCYLMR